MTTLEIILIAVVWMGYGAFAGMQTKITIRCSDKIALEIFFLIFAPIIFVLKAMYGAFKEYKD